MDAFDERAVIHGRRIRFHFIGDSITVGYGVAAGFAKMLCGERDAIEINYAVCGSTAEKHLWQAEQISGAVAAWFLPVARRLRLAPIEDGDRIIYLAGFNDVRLRTPGEVYRAQFNTVLGRLQGTRLPVLVGNCIPMRSDGYARWGGDTAQLLAINEIIAQMCARRGMTCVDVCGRYDPKNTQDDGAHPSEAGHRQIAEAFGAALRGSEVTSQ